MRIRASRPEDADCLFEIWRGAAVATHHFLAPADFSFFADLVRDSYLPSAALTVATDETDHLIGFIGMTDNKIDALFVAPEKMDRGVGRRLIAEAGAGHCRLLVDVNEQNEAAVAFYRRLGFRCVGRSELDETGRPYPILHLARTA